MFIIFISAMPKTKVGASATAVKKPRVARKATPKTIKPKKKTKAILVDVIEDDPLDAELSWPEEQSDRNVSPVGARRREIKMESDLEIDQQKIFYSQLAAELKDSPDSEEKSGSEEATPHRRVGLYRRQFFKYFVFVGLIAAAVVYFSYSKLTVTVNLKGEKISNSLLLKVSQAADSATSTPDSLFFEDEGSVSDIASDPREAVSGSVKTVEVQVFQDYPATGETFLGDDITGEVRIINNYSKSQALVATTRLLTTDGKLFRIAEAVNVPAGGEVKVKVYADKPAPDMAVGPTSFTIPGLWAGLQDQIYARSDEAFVFTKKVRKHVNASDLEFAARDINERLLEAAKEQVRSSLGDDWLYQAEGAPEIIIDAKIGEQKENFSAQASGRMVAVSFDKQQVADLAQSKLNLVMPSSKELADFQGDQISYSLENYDKNSGSATIKAVFSGTMIFKNDAAIIDARQLVNLSAEQISTYLQDRPEVREFKLEFFPSFIKKAPSLSDRIKVEVNKN